MEGTAMNKVLHGVVHGQTIQLSEPVGVADGQEVEVVVRTSVSSRPWGEGIRKSAGGMSRCWTEEDEQILERIRQDRKRETRPEIPPL